MLDPIYIINRSSLKMVCSSDCNLVQNLFTSYFNLVVLDCTWYTSCAAWATNDIRPPDGYAFGVIATAEITNTPNSAIARIIAILIMITHVFLTIGNYKGLTTQKRTNSKVVSLAYFKIM